MYSELNKNIRLELERIFSQREKNIISLYRNASKAEIYRDIARKFSVHPERVRKHHRIMNSKEIVKYGASENNRKFNKSTGVLESTVIADFDPKSDKELATLHKVDLSKYDITSYWSKQLSNGKFTSSILCRLRQVESDLSLQKDVIIKELFSKAPKFGTFKQLEKSKTTDNLLLISLFDIHFGKLAHKDESGEDYDLKVAEARVKSAVKELLSRVNLKSVEKILLPIGNDLINVDNLQKSTTAGTPQDTDTRFHKMIKTANRVLIDVINELVGVAPVDVLIVPGNHDTQTSFMIGCVLEAYYHNTKLVNIDNSPTLRKYYQFGKNGFQFTHGDKEKHETLGLIFATEKPKLWADTKYRFCQLGHFHKNKKTNFVSVDEHQGFQVQIIPSLSSNDAWHAGKGYNSLRQAKAFMYSKNDGLTGEFTYTIPTVS